MTATTTYRAGDRRGHRLLPHARLHRRARCDRSRRARLASPSCATRSSSGRRRSPSTGRGRRTSRETSATSRSCSRARRCSGPTPSTARRSGSGRSSSRSALMGFAARVLVRPVPRQAAAEERARRCGTRTRATGAATSTTSASPAGCRSTTSTSATGACTSSTAASATACSSTASPSTCRAICCSASPTSRGRSRARSRVGSVTFHH